MPQPDKHAKPDPKKKQAGPLPRSNPVRQKQAESQAPTPSRRRDTPDAESQVLSTLQSKLFQSVTPEQALLNIIADALAPTLESPDFHIHRQTIKTHFFHRRFLDIFTSYELLPVYAAEYIPTRALCYRRVCQEIKQIRDVLGRAGGCKVMCLGAGNGSEVVGVAAAYWGVERLKWLKEKAKEKRKAAAAVASDSTPSPSNVSEPNVPTSPRPPPKKSHLELSVQDLSSYGPVIPSLLTSIKSHIPQPPAIKLTESQYDLLDPPDVAPFFPDMLQAHMVMACFVLNELLTTNKAKFPEFLIRLLNSMMPGTLLLVIDSASSFSDLSLGSAAVADGEDKQQSSIYKLTQLLDHLKGLELVTASDAEWYRCPEGLVYPCKVNDMRYCLRLYRRVEESDAESSVDAE
ncbi:hypothetical protein DFS34DRAFT_598864 [Phlyctochytrium arcticum]|nr:hypothetical protein DFS34DRAFT_598864 [Phlyctochytrium arcticum]